MFITDTSGNKSLTATLAVVGFFVTMLKLLLSGASISIGSFSYSFGNIDAAMIAAVLTPVLGTYTARRWGSPASSGPPSSDEDAGSKPNGGAE
ncbi:MAG TPA: hypothetical protein VFT74_19010 [Isosphaeraceae bacterium]|nr:hypothetical protein [Isosphaeraceae bacterium]